jgi:hypothetical protein
VKKNLGHDPDAGNLLAWVLTQAIVYRSGKRESDQSRAKQHKTHNGHSEETVRSKLLTHGAPPNRAPRALLEGNDRPVAQSKELHFQRSISIQVDASVQHQRTRELIALSGI